MQQKQRGGARSGCLTALFAFVTVTVLATSAAVAETQAAKASGGGQYFIEFRSRYAWDYGHTYMVFGRVGERLTTANVAGLSPVGDDATAWVIGHYVPVPAETGATDGDLEEKYISARYRVSMDKAEYDRVVAYIRHLQATSHVWSAPLYNCNAFAGDVAKFMGLKVPASSIIYPRVYVSNLRKINTGHPEAATELASDNLKEMESPTRDGRAMIMNGIYKEHNGVYAVDPNRVPQSTTPEPTQEPRVIIGPVRVSSQAADAGAASEPSR
ncbi:MAG TPA: hypothetical protein VGJ20_26795 [Xanthobacteraceae bacterium]